MSLLKTEMTLKTEKTEKLESFYYSHCATLILTVRIRQGVRINCYPGISPSLRRIQLALDQLQIELEAPSRSEFIFGNADLKL